MYAPLPQVQVPEREGKQPDLGRQMLGAADLAGVVLTKPEIEVASKVVRAEIVNHPQDDASDRDPNVVPRRQQKKGGCCVQ